MAWSEIMTSAHAALARAEWALEGGDPGHAAQELRIGTAQAMLAWLKAHHPNSPLHYGYASVLRDFAAAATSGTARALLRLHYRTANLDSVAQGVHHGLASGWDGRTSAPISEDEVGVALEASHGAVRALEEQLKGEEPCGD